MVALNTDYVLVDLPQNLNLPTLISSNLEKLSKYHFMYMKIEYECICNWQQFILEKNFFKEKLTKDPLLPSIWS